jgi:hypothetical protein
MVVHWVQPGRGLVTCQPGDCLTRWHARLHAWALQAQVTPPLSNGCACSKSDSLACREQAGKEHLPSRTWTKWRSVPLGWYPADACR